jgi:hypothetical protein
MNVRSMYTKIMKTVCKPDYSCGVKLPVKCIAWVWILGCVGRGGGERERERGTKMQPDKISRQMLRLHLFSYTNPLRIAVREVVCRGYQQWGSPEQHPSTSLHIITTQKFDTNTNSLLLVTCSSDKVTKSVCFTTWNLFPTEDVTNK